jgi:hypothetical protein
MLRNLELISSASITARATILTSFLHLANPLLSQGILVGRHSFDSTRRVQTEIIQDHQGGGAKTTMSR